MSKRKVPEDKILIRERKNGLSGKDISIKYKVSPACVCRHLRRLGINAESPIGKRGENHSQWKGGRGMKTGYWCVYAPEHPRAMNNGRVWEHIIKLEKHIGKSIPKGMPIHHKDFNRKNNNLSNLYLCKNHSEHQKVHSSADAAFAYLFKKGYVGFQRGQYYINFSKVK